MEKIPRLHTILTSSVHALGSAVFHLLDRVNSKATPINQESIRTTVDPDGNTATIEFLGPSGRTRPVRRSLLMDTPTIQGAIIEEPVQLPELSPAAQRAHNDGLKQLARASHQVRS